MLFYHFRELCNGILLLMLVILACAGYAYYINSRRLADDPNKKDFHPLAIFLAPFTWPFFFLAFIFIFILRALLYGVFLILITIALIMIRNSFLLLWLHKIATYIGNKLLEANTFLIKLFLKPWADSPESP